MSGSANLKSLRDKPFELLRELERLARLALTGQGRAVATEREWVGVAFRLSSENFLVAREETREVLGYPSVVTRVPGAKPWIRGVANVRVSSCGKRRRGGPGSRCTVPRAISMPR